MEKEIKKIEGKIVETVTKELTKEQLKTRNTVLNATVAGLTARLAEAQIELDQCEADCEAMEVEM